MNVALLEKLKEYIRANPQSIDMRLGLNQCQTVGCIAGLIVLIERPDALGNEVGLSRQIVGNRYNWNQLRKLAEKLLEISDPNHMDRDPNLFYSTDWPESIETLYDEAEDEDSTVEAICQAIDYYIAHPDEMY